MSDDTIRDVFQRMTTASGCSVDDILETPSLREEFLTKVRSVMGEYAERDLLHRLVYLRKRSKLPRSRDVATA